MVLAIMHEIDSVVCRSPEKPATRHATRQGSRRQVNGSTPLVTGEKGRGKWWCTIRYKNTRKCVSSKAALLTLLWSFVVGVINSIALNAGLYYTVLAKLYSDFSSAVYSYCLVALLSSLYPTAGLLADIKWGRYKVVITSLYMLLSFAPFAILCYIVTQNSPQAPTVLIGLYCFLVF